MSLHLSMEILGYLIFHYYTGCLIVRILTMIYSVRFYYNPNITG